MNMDGKEIHSTLCRMCDEHCALDIHLEQGRICAIRGHESHPWSKGRVCGKAQAAIAMAYSRDRILKPLKKVGGKWAEIELAKALDEIAEKLSEIKKNYGARSVGVWKGEAIGFAQESDLYRRFIQAFGSPNYFSNDSACYIGRHMGYRLGFGLHPVPDYENSRCIVLWGSNPLASHPNTSGRVVQAVKNGAKLAVVDPRRISMCRTADLYLPVRPGTDGCLALGLARILIETGRYDREFVAGYCIGFEKYAAHVEKFSLKYVEQETGVPAKTIEQLADLLMEAAPHVAINVGTGPEHHVGGVQGIRAIALLDALLGAFDRPGGNRWVEALENRELILGRDVSIDRLSPIGAEEFPVTYDFRRECNTMRLMDTLLSDRPYPVKGMILSGANPVVSNANSLKVREALSRLELFVVRDLFMTPTAELAHYILPAATFLERSEIHCHGAVQVVNMTRRIFAQPGVQDEYEFLRGLACRLNLEPAFPWKDEDELNRWLLEPTGINAGELGGSAEGILYKPVRYEKWRDTPIPTPSGKVEFASNYLKELGLPELPDYDIPLRMKPGDNEEYPFLLITGIRKTLYAYGQCHASGGDLKEPEVEMHPGDATLLGLLDGDWVLVASRIGSVRMKTKIVPPGDIVAGCVAVAHGIPNFRINELTFDDRLDPLDGFPALKSVLVKIEKA